MIDQGGNIMAANLKGKHVASVVTDGLERSELTKPRGTPDDLRAFYPEVIAMIAEDYKSQGITTA
jgi:hypothetical protein